MNFNRLFLAGILALLSFSSVQAEYVLYGTVYDSQSHETLIAAHVFDSIGCTGVITNEFGYYSLRQPSNQRVVVFSYTGYKPKTVKFELNSDSVCNVYLDPVQELQEVVVQGTRPNVGLQSSRMGASHIPVQYIKSHPAILGEPDLLKSIQTLPGVNRGLAGTCGLNVRGGDLDQNLFLLDGTPLYNVNHAFGFLSVFTPEAVKSVDLYKASFPARFGGRLSSILDIRTSDGDMQHFHGTINMGMASSHFHLEGPIVKDRSSFRISARRSYLDLILRPFVSDDSQTLYSLYDVNAKLNVCVPRLPQSAI